MKLTPHPQAIADFIGTRIRQARFAHQRAKLQRELSRLPDYVARDIGVGPNQDGFVNYLDG